MFGFFKKKKVRYYQLTFAVSPFYIGNFPIHAFTRKEGDKEFYTDYHTDFTIKVTGDVSRSKIISLVEKASIENESEKTREIAKILLEHATLIAWSEVDEY